MKKLSLVFICILSLICIQTTVHAQSKIKKDSVKLRLALLDSLNKQTVPIAQLKEKYNSAFINRSEIICPEEKIILGNGARSAFQTTDNKKIKSILSRLFSMSPVDFLLAIRGIEGRIIIQTTYSSWVKQEDISQLVKLATVDVITPEIMPESLGYINYSSPSKLEYTKTPMGINALVILCSYFYGTFPSMMPSYESVKTWYDSGKPKQEYKFESFIPYVKEQIPPHRKEPKFPVIKEPKFLQKSGQ